MNQLSPEYRPRTFRDAWRAFMARWGGYFWKPCPVCGEYFGGNEVKDNYAVLYTSRDGGSITCNKRACMYAADVRSWQQFQKGGGVVNGKYYRVEYHTGRGKVIRVYLVTDDDR